MVFCRDGLNSFWDNCILHQKRKEKGEKVSKWIKRRRVKFEKR